MPCARKKLRPPSEKHSYFYNQKFEGVQFRDGMITHVFGLQAVNWAVHEIFDYAAFAIAKRTDNDANSARPHN